MKQASLLLGCLLLSFFCSVQLMAEPERELQTEYDAYANGIYWGYDGFIAKISNYKSETVLEAASHYSSIGKILIGLASEPESGTYDDNLLFRLELADKTYVNFNLGRINDYSVRYKDKSYIPELVIRTAHDRVTFFDTDLQFIALEKMETYYKSKERYVIVLDSETYKKAIKQVISIICSESKRLNRDVHTKFKDVEIDELGIG